MCVRETVCIGRSMDVAIGQPVSEHNTADEYQLEM